ncbi:hypothetical protein FRC17_005082 [Serendipita sp. 399]|nr:hypothetical protein FRC17_005082 [Serendipita sp. 399]
MPGKRRKIDEASGKQSLEALFEEIKAVLAIVKPVLAKFDQKEANDVAQALHSIAKLGESFTRLRNASKDEEVVRFIDHLDVEGVSLWNISIFMAKNDDVPKDVFAAGFRLIEAGLDFDPSPEGGRAYQYNLIILNSLFLVLASILELSSKSGIALAAADAELADEVLTNAASYERRLDELPHSVDPSIARDRARATVVYYTSRMEAAWEQNNLDVASYMMKKINDRQIEILLPQDVVDGVVSRILEIGQSLLKRKSGDSTEEERARAAAQSIPWLQRSLAIVDKGPRDAVWLSARRRVILRNLARAYFLSSADHPENLDRADAALTECLTELDQSKDASVQEYQQLRWMCLALCKKRKTSDESFSKALLPLIEDSPLDEDSIKDILLELKSISKSHSAIVTQALQRLVQRTLNHVDGHPVADKVIFALIMHMRTIPDHESCIKSIHAALDDVTASEGYTFDRTSAFAFLTTFWQFGDHNYDRKRWGHAADWYMLGTHPIFEVVADVTGSKCLRKAALARIYDQDYTSAKTLIERCPSRDAPTHYLSFLSAVNQAQTEDAIRAIEMMARAPDFDRKMLLLATSLARDAQDRTLLHAVLVALLDTLKSDGQEDGNQERITLIRCMIRLVLQMMEDPDADLYVTLIAEIVEANYLSRSKLVPLLLSHSRIVASKALKEGKELAFGTDLSWLWRSTYNAAVKGIGVWGDDHVTDMFGIASQARFVHTDVLLAD